MSLGSIQPLTEMSTRNILGSNGRPALRADNLAAIYEPIVQKMWEPQHLTTLGASTACYRDTFTFFFSYHHMLITCGYQVVRSRITTPRVYF
jgi:hypothetical protein